MGWSVAQRFGLTHHRPQHSYKGYTLVIPLQGDSCFSRSPILDLGYISDGICILKQELCLTI